MSIADKLTTIAQNQQAVYDAGKAEILNSIDTMYRMFEANHRMELLPIVLAGDVSKFTNWQYAFASNTKLMGFRAPETMHITLPHGLFQSCTSVVTVSGLDKAIDGVVLTDLFNGCTSLVDAGTLNFQGVQYANRTFQNCTALVEVRITGLINLSVSFAQSSKLSFASIESIINHLAKRTGLPAMTLTLHSSVGAKLTAAQKATITAMNWTLVY